MPADRDELPHIFTTDDRPTGAQWRCYWRRAFSDAVALCEQATALPERERRLYIGRAVALALSVAEGGNPDDPSERREWLAGWQRIKRAVAPLNTARRSWWRIAAGDPWWAARERAIRAAVRARRGLRPRPLRAGAFPPRA